MTDIPELNYDGAFYKAIGDFQRETYLEEGYTQGTVQEVAFLIEHLNLKPSSRILDVGCGTGRHCLEFAKRGFELVGVDISDGHIGVAKRLAAEQNLNAEFMVLDARAMNFNTEFDAAICLCEGAFGIAGDEMGHRQILAGTARALRPKTPFVLTAINALSAVRNLPNPGTIRFDPYTLTSYSKWTPTSPEGETREFDGYCTAFTYHELKWLLEGAGFVVQNAYGCVAGRFESKALTLEDIEIMMIAKKT
jgi:cyclopropane fatty-acyl-phospholipid synthase-like methyltransferase